MTQLLLISRLILALSLTISAWAAGDDATPLIARLRKLETVADIDYRQAMQQLNLLTPQIERSNNYILLRDYYTLLTRLQMQGNANPAAQISSTRLLKLASQAADPIGQANALSAQALILSLAGKPLQALELTKHSLPLANQSKHILTLVRSMDVQAQIYGVLGQLDRALKLQLQALTLLQDQQGRGLFLKLNLLGSIGTSYANLRDFERGLSYNLQAQALAKSLGAHRSQTSLLLNQGFFEASMDRYEAGKQLTQQALLLAQQYQQPDLEALCLSNLSDHALREKNYDLAYAHAKRALGLADAFSDRSIRNAIRFNLGAALIGKNQVPTGSHEILAVIAETENDGSLTEAESMLRELGHIYAQAGWYHDAYHVLQRQQQMADKLFRRETSRALAEFQDQSDTQKRQHEIDKLTQQNRLKDAELQNRRLQQNLAILGGSLSAVIGILLFILYRRSRITNAQLQVANTELAQQSLRDPLTGLHNRRFFQNQMLGRVNNRRDPKFNNEPSGLLILDIDHFKKINDQYGHAVGDAVLIEIGARLSKLMRDSDYVLRWGGEEFLIYLKHIPNREMVRVAQRILDAIGSLPVASGDQQVPVTASAGFVPMPLPHVLENDFNWEKLLGVADQALYLSKANGRNRAHVVLDLFDNSPPARALLEQDLRQAWDKQILHMVEVIGPLASNRDDEDNHELAFNPS